LAKPLNRPAALNRLTVNTSMPIAMKAPAEMATQAGPPVAYSQGKGSDYYG